MKSFPLTQEHKLEYYKSRKHEALFDKVHYTVRFIPGFEGKGMIVRNFVDAIKAHDEIVKKVEEKWQEIDELKRDFSRKNRQFRNFDSAWNMMNANPDDYNEYVELAPRMKNIVERMKLMTNHKVKARAETEYKRYLELEPKCIKLIEAQKQLEAARAIRDAARKALQDAEVELSVIRLAEKDLSERICDDHIMADEKKITLSELFPNVHPGYILYAVNGNIIATLPFEEAETVVRKLRTPHKVDLRRYDYRFDPVRNEWHTLQELRDMGCCVEDPMLSASNFVNTASRGDLDGIKRLLLQGENPDSVDYTGCTAMQVAAMNGHDQIVDILKKAGATVDKRDHNLMTPLLSCICRGDQQMVWKLKEYGADLTASDRNHRNAAYYAVISGVPSIVRQFVTATNCNFCESLWGYSPLHVAAYQGRLDLVNQLLMIGSSIFTRDKQGRIPEEVAMDAGKEDVRLVLQQERLTGPAQLVHEDPELELRIWIGEESALDPKWCSIVEITDILYAPYSMQSIPPHCQWLFNDEIIQQHTIPMDISDSDESDRSWNILSEHMLEISHYMYRVLKRGKGSILVCCPSGNSTCVAIVTAAMLLRFQIRTAETLTKCARCRPSTRVSMSLLTGLEVMQRNFDEQRLKRLDMKLRNAMMTSCAF